ncbi:gamma-glutamyl-gamma-aminobutyrate hydrolase family protein [Pseudomonas sp. LP_7_YM]|uniref:glutamine amidotransferase-related protein n=1 Tax=Pseudomonas sp. LP_7_YM TaxID=2485137 RepID=UPI00105DD04F|nr:gamma-glutamyl-gamma-aminobutyrate hydrolase family protein [Pseudomonas sp. LP_7_YM]TDV67509.1 CTP synthase [Pseudomonas sp. LP_7_YM]
MTLTLVSHSPCSPALFGALAACVAQAEDALLMHFPADFHVGQGMDGVQMVAAEGALVASGFVWYERMTGREIRPVSNIKTVIDTARQHAVVLPWDTTLQSDVLRETLLAQAHAAGLSARHLTVLSQNGAWHVEDHDGIPTAHGRWRQDAFGRWVNHESDTPHDAYARSLCIALLGSEADQRDVYPATLAALGDAADAAQVNLDIRFIAPAQLDVSQLDWVDGIVLPGGCDMTNVPGQIRAARHALASGIPVMGLCLGMQSMTTALAQTIAGFEQANMAEAAPDAAIKSFVPMAGIAELEVHRLGERRLQFRDAALEYRFQHHLTIRCNHRFMLNPELIPPLLTAGLVITATDVSGQIVDMIDWPSHPFYQGMQGHPELGSRAGAPHPLIKDFLLAAQASANAGAASPNDH